MRCHFDLCREVSNDLVFLLDYLLLFDEDFFVLCELGLIG